MAHPQRPRVRDAVFRARTGPAWRSSCRDSSHLRYCGHNVTVFHLLDPHELGVPLQRHLALRGTWKWSRALTTQPKAHPRGLSCRNCSGFLDQVKSGCQRVHADYAKLVDASPPHYGGGPLRLFDWAGFYSRARDHDAMKWRRHFPGLPRRRGAAARPAWRSRQTGSGPNARGPAGG